MKKQVIFPVFIGCAVVWGMFQLILANIPSYAAPISHSEEIVQSELTTTSISFSSEKIITTEAFGANAVGAADLDNDGDLDVFASCNKNDQVTGHEKIEWYENSSADGSTWTVHTIVNFWDAPTDIVGADLDADGDVDLVVPAHDHTMRVSWFDSDGASPPGFTERYVVSGYGPGFNDVQVIDMSQDGAADVLVSAGYVTDEVLWFASDGGTIPSFTMNIIDDTLTDPQGIFGADLENDGDIDVIATDITENKVIWYESTGGDSPTFTTAHIITDTAGGAKGVFSTDMNQDGHNDIVVAAQTDGKVYLFESDGSSPPTFHAYTIEENSPGVRAVYAIDLDLDTDVDIVTASSGDDTIAVLENLNTVPPSFQKHVLGTTADAASNVYAADIDNDGDPDVLSASSLDDTIAWYENLVAGPEPTYSISGEVRESSGAPIAGATISAGYGLSATTDASGAYTLTNLITGTYTLTPSLTGWAFAPITRTVTLPPSVNGQDFTGSPAGPSTLNLTVDLQGRADDSGTLFTAWSGAEEAGACTSASDGACSIELPTGTYSVTAEMALYLDSVWDSVSISDGGSTTLPTVTLLGGDTNDDGAINIQDLSFIGYRFNACVGDPLYDVRADINADGCINILDLTVAGANWGRTCPVPW